MLHEEFTRQIDLIPIEKLNKPVTIIGVGAIGSWTALCLAKMGIDNITVYDPDIVERVNMNSQLYKLSDVGKPKVEALFRTIKDFTGVEINTIRGKYDGRALPGIVIMAVDSMAVRSEIHEAHELAATTDLIIDSRMAIEFAMLYAYNPNSKEDREFFTNTLYSDEDAVQERCTAKSIGYTAMLLSGYVVKTVKDFIVGSKYSRNVQWSIKENQLKVWRNE